MLLPVRCRGIPGRSPGLLLFLQLINILRRSQEAVATPGLKLIKFPLSPNELFSPILRSSASCHWVHFPRNEVWAALAGHCQLLPGSGVTSRQSQLLPAFHGGPSLSCAFPSGGSETPAD